MEIEGTVPPPQVLLCISRPQMGKKDSKTVTAGGIPLGLSGGILPAVASNQIQSSILTLDAITFYFMLFGKKDSRYIIRMILASTVPSFS